MPLNRFHAGLRNQQMLERSGISDGGEWKDPQTGRTYQRVSGTWVAVYDSRVPSAPPSAEGANFADAETPSGVLDGVNTEFSLLHTPTPQASLMLYMNGLFQAPNGSDYSLSGATITFILAPNEGSTILASYRY